MSVSMELQFQLLGKSYFKNNTIYMLVFDKNGNKWEISDSMRRKRHSLGRTLYSAEKMTD